MLAASHLNKNLDVMKHSRVYKHVAVTGGHSYDKCEEAARKYFANIGYIELFRHVGRVDGKEMFEGLVVVVTE